MELDYFNKLEPNLNIFPNNNISDLGTYCERAFQDQYNVFLFEMFEYEHQLFQKSVGVIKEEEETKLIGQKDNIFQIIKHWFENIMKVIKGLFAKFINKVKEIQYKINEKINSKTVKKFQDAVDVLRVDDSINFTPLKFYRPEIISGMISGQGKILGGLTDAATKLKVTSSL